MFLSIFKWICYAALIVVAGGFLGMLVLSAGDFCSSLSTGSIKCGSETAQSLAELSFGIVLITIFTGIPGLLALGGVIFAIIALFRRFGPEPPEPEEDGTEPPSRLKYYGKIALYIFLGYIALAVVGGVLAGIFM